MMIYRLDENLGIKQLIWVAIGFVMFFVFTMCILKFTNGTDLPIYTYLFLLFVPCYIDFGKEYKRCGKLDSNRRFFISTGGTVQDFVCFFLASYFKNPDNCFWENAYGMRGLECFQTERF